jgi:hypothetical protein
MTAGVLPPAALFKAPRAVTVVAAALPPPVVVVTLIPD